MRDCKQSREAGSRYQLPTNEPKFKPRSRAAVSYRWLNAKKLWETSDFVHLMDSEVEFCMLEQVEKEKSRITATVLRSATFALLIIVSASLQAQTVGASDPSISDTMTNLLQGN